MEKLKLSISDALVLELELNGRMNQSTGEILFKGFLSENIDLRKKYWLTKLADKLSADKKIVEDLQKKLIEDYNLTPDENGQIFIEDQKEREKFQSDVALLYSEEKEYDYNPVITIDDLEKINSAENYRILFKTVKED